MADISQIVLKDSSGNVIGTYDVKDATVPHTSESAASGGTTLSLVTTGEKATWNAKSDTDTKNTAGSTNNTSKLYLIGALEQSANPQTYSNSDTYYELGVFHAKNFKASYSNDSVTIDGNGIVKCQNSSSVTMSYISSGSNYYGGITVLKDPTGTFDAVRLSGREGLICNGNDVTLGTSGSSSNDSGDIVWKYGNGKEKARIWTDNTYTSAKGLNYRLYKEDGTQLTNGTIPLANTYLPLAGGIMTGTITLASTGLQTPAASGFTTDSSGNFKHRQTTNTDYWHLDSNNGSVLLKYYWETGNLVVPGTITAAVTDVSSSFSVSGNFQSVTKKLFKFGNVVELFMTANVKTAIADNAVIFTVPNGYNPKVNDAGFTFFTGTDPYIPVGMKFGYFTWGGTGFHTLGALGVGTQVTAHFTYLV